jgi:hypothetical protein
LRTRLQQIGVCHYSALRSGRVRRRCPTVLRRVSSHRAEHLIALAIAAVTLLIVMCSMQLRMYLHTVEKGRRSGLSRPGQG